MLSVLFSLYFSFAIGNSHCDWPKTELVLNNVVYALLKDDLLPKGDILDVGAYHGHWACLYACFDPTRKVHAVDPSPQNVQDMKCSYPNMLKHNYGVSDYLGNMTVVITSGFIKPISAPRKDGDSEPITIPVSTLDALFSSWGSRAGFLHIDVEGYEINAIRGAKDVLTRDRPMVTVEMHVVGDKETNLRLVQELQKMKYKVFMINEICGTRKDCRNFLCVPDEIIPNFIRSPAMQLVVRTGGLIPVDHDTLLLKFSTYSKSAAPWKVVDPFH
jgi:FkbM family methyltransferase